MIFTASINNIKKLCLHELLYYNCIALNGREGIIVDLPPKKTVYRLHEGKVLI